MSTGILIPDGNGGHSVIYVEPGDIVLSCYHGGSRVGRTLSKMIRWIPGAGRLTGYSHAMMWGDEVRDTKLISAEGGEVKFVSLVSQYLSTDYSIVIVRDHNLTPATRLRAAVKARQLLHTRYSKATIAAHALDTLLTLGGLIKWWDRPAASLVGKFDDGVVCSEMVAQAYFQGTGSLFRKWRRKRSTVKWYTCRPRDIEYTASIERWTVVHKTSHGVAVKDEGRPGSER